MRMTEPEKLGAAALELVGVPFRMHGRDAATGLDCVGVALAALEAVGRCIAVPDDYTLRGGDLQRFDRWAAECGLRRVSPENPEATGDIVLVQAGIQQFHVLVDAGAVMVHAHLGLRRVAALPKPSQWPVLRRWRLEEGD
jgi:hypothetical protein